MNFQNLFSGGKKEKNIINLPSAELAQRVVNVKVEINLWLPYILRMFFCNVVV